MAGYTPDYTSSDLSEIVIDFLAEFGIQIIAFAGLIGLAVVFVWFRDHF